MRKRKAGTAERPREKPRARVSDAITNTPTPPGAGGAETMREICERTHMDDRRVRAQMYKFQAQGKLGVAKEMRPKLDGSMCRVPVYWIIEV